MNPRFELDGRPVSPDVQHLLTLAGYGHFTAMQVRDRRTRGLDLHLTRLDNASRELFGTGLDGGRVRAHIRHALGDDVSDASVRVYVFSPSGPDASGSDVSLLVSVKAPGEGPRTPQRLLAVPWQRPVAHIKHTGSFGQAYYGRHAELNGYDDALLTGPDGTISEGAIANLCGWDGSTVVWPDAPFLHGITMQLLERGLAEQGIPSVWRPVLVRDLRAFEGVFLTNSRGIAAVERVDDVSLPVATGFLKTLVDIYDSAPWDLI